MLQSLYSLAATGSFCWFFASSLWIYPHSLSYFNESIGGPLNGPKHLLGSNVDWGQDLIYLKKWMDETGTPEEPLAVRLIELPGRLGCAPALPLAGMTDAKSTAMGKRTKWVFGFLSAKLGGNTVADPNVFAVSVDYVFSTHPKGNGSIPEIHREGKQFWALFQKEDPLECIGYTAYVYRSISL